MTYKRKTNEVTLDVNLIDFQGNTINFSHYPGHKHLILVFNRGFM